MPISDIVSDVCNVESNPATAHRLKRFQTTLDRLEKRSQLRKLSPRVGYDFSSNDYLGLSTHPQMIKALHTALDNGTAIGATGSRLLRGNCVEHEALEEKAARFFGTEKALFFGAGYMANHALLTTLPRQGDLIIHDALIHASSHDGMSGSKANSIAARHNDPNHVEDLIVQWREQGNKGQIWIAFESLYSMDGDRADLTSLDAIARKYDAVLIADEAHATGVFGPEGRGFSADLEGLDHVISVHTCGKALGAQGALICCNETIHQYLINRSRPFIFATLTAVAVSTALDLVASEPERRARLHHLIAHFGKRLKTLSSVEKFPASGSQIQPIILGNNARTMRMAETMQMAGFDIRGIRPPTVPDGSARLRVALNVTCDEAVLDAMTETLKQTLEEEKAK